MNYANFVGIKCPHCGGEVEQFEGITGNELVCTECGATKELGPIIEKKELVADLDIDYI